MTGPKTLESVVERRFVSLLHKLGVEAVKLNVRGYAGMPDRLVLLPGGRAVFVELKRPGEKPRLLQAYVHRKLRNLGFEVLVVDDAIDAIATIERYLK